MKKIFLCFGLILGFSIAHAQDINDALRYSSEKLAGTARFTSMGGAFGALGGDISALKVNPAGSSVFLTNFGSFTLNNETYKNDVFFGNNLIDKKNNTFGIDQAGAVWVFNSYKPKATLTKFALGITYGKTNSFNNRYIAAGNNTQSISDYFLNMADGVPLDLFTPQGNENISDLYSYLGTTDFSKQGFNNNNLQTAYLGYESLLFDSTDDTDSENKNYFSNVSGNNFDQDYNYTATGMNGKFTLNGSLTLNDKFYLGLNLNSHFINYEKTTQFTENIAQPSKVNQIYFDNTLKSNGVGYSFQLGGIAKVGDILRLGASYQSPVWYTISDETTQFVGTFSEKFDDGDPVIADPNVVNKYPDYKLRTPGKMTGSIAVVFASHGLLSFDYSRKDYSNTKYGSKYSQVDYQVENNAIENELQAASTYRIGGEYRLSQWSLRAGFRYEESPYQNEETMSELKGYSAGLGYDFGNLRLDVAYDLAQRDYNLPLSQTGLTQTAAIDNNRSNISLTLGFRM